MHPFNEKMLRSCYTCTKKLNDSEPTYHCVRCSCDLHLKQIRTGLSSVALNGIKEQTVTDLLLLCNKCLETGKQERLLATTMASSNEMSGRGQGSREITE